jgi:hypothetical protein
MTEPRNYGLHANCQGCPKQGNCFDQCDHATLWTRNARHNQPYRPLQPLPPDLEALMTSESVAEFRKLEPTPEAMQEAMKNGWADKPLVSTPTEPNPYYELWELSKALVSHSEQATILDSPDAQQLVAGAMLMTEQLNYVRQHPDPAVPAAIAREYEEALVSLLIAHTLPVAAIQPYSVLAIAPVYKWSNAGTVMVPQDTDLTNLPAKQYMLEFFCYETIWHYP